MNTNYRLYYRRTFATLLSVMAGNCLSHAQSLSSGTSALSRTAEGISMYLPYVQNMCYVIAGCISIVGALGVYIRMMEESGRVKGAVLSTVGSCLFFLCAANALPAFFTTSGRYTDSGLRPHMNFDDWFDDEAPLSAHDLMVVDRPVRRS